MFVLLVFLNKNIIGKNYTRNTNEVVACNKNESGANLYSSAFPLSIESLKSPADSAIGKSRPRNLVSESVQALLTGGKKEGYDDLGGVGSQCYQDQYQRDYYPDCPDNNKKQLAHCYTNGPIIKRDIRFDHTDAYGSGLSDVSYGKRQTPQRIINSRDSSRVRRSTPSATAKRQGVQGQRVYGKQPYNVLLTEQKKLVLRRHKVLPSSANKIAQSRMIMYDSQKINRTENKSSQNRKKYETVISPIHRRLQPIPHVLQNMRANQRMEDSDRSSDKEFNKDGLSVWSASSDERNGK